MWNLGLGFVVDDRRQGKTSLIFEARWENFPIIEFNHTNSMVDMKIFNQDKTNLHLPLGIS